MTLPAAVAAKLMMSVTEAGGATVVALVVDSPYKDYTGKRLAIVESTPGAQLNIHGGLGSEALDKKVSELMWDALQDPRSHDGLRRVETDAGTLELYLEVKRAVQELIVVGAGHIAQPMAHLGALLGFKVTVLDDRPDFATRERFPEAERLVAADFSNPFADITIHSRSHLLLVTRGHKYDYECLIRALKMDPPPAYIGMIGSRRRVRATYVQLLDEGIGHDLIDRIHAPVGLNIGAETPEEIAVAVAAELVMLRRGGTGLALKDVERIAERFFKEDEGEGQT